ncbi:unnamed protein product, partial [Didymodactylos carnosus]
MSGADNWNLQQQEEFFGEALKLQSNFRVTSSHETHRGRSLFNPSLTEHLLKKFPDLRITADYSHWIVVCERLLDPAYMKLFASHVDHIHARVGYDQHAQISGDINDSHWREERDMFQQYWQQIWEEHFKQKRQFTSLDPEYGPVPYTQTDPNRNYEPITDAWIMAN